MFYYENKIEKCIQQKNFSMIFELYCGVCFYSVLIALRLLYVYIL